MSALHLYFYKNKKCLDNFFFGQKYLKKFLTKVATNWQIPRVFDYLSCQIQIYRLLSNNIIQVNTI